MFHTLLIPLQMITDFLLLGQSYLFPIFSLFFTHYGPNPGVPYMPSPFVLFILTHGLTKLLKLALNL